MHAKNRLPSSGHNSPSPPQSPLRSPRLRHGRSSKPGGRFPTVVPKRSLAHRLSWILLSVLLRRQGVFLFAPIIYISGMLLYMGTAPFDVVPSVMKHHRAAAGSVYRSPELYAKLRHEMDADNSTADAPHRTAPRSVYQSSELYAKLRHEVNVDNSTANVPHPTDPGSVNQSTELYPKLRHEMDADNSTANTTHLAALGSLDWSLKLYAKLWHQVDADNSTANVPHQAAPGSLYWNPKLYDMLRHKMNADNSTAVTTHRAVPGSVYRSPKLYAKLRHEIYAEKTTATKFALMSTIWKHAKGGDWRPCINKSSGGLPESNGYIYIEANGGLNQQRTSICNAVAVAGYLNATLVIPNFHFHSIWRDPSKFRDIYDEEFFVKTLENDVRVVDTIPGYLMERFDYNMSNVFNFKIKAWSPIQYYRDTVLPRLLEEKVIRISPFANRLSFDAPPAVQRLRCLANYEALRFSNPILTIAESLVARMKERSAHNGGKYISVHLRFEEDMVAFSCCVYDGGAKEEEDMAAARERGWKGKFTKPGRVLKPGANRVNGKCPLTPLEVGLMLRGMGFDNSTSIFLASGRIYDSERYMAPLLEMFPLLQTKEMLASPEELDPYKNYSSRMAAIDYTVCLHSEVFVTTQGGNFPHFLLGHRRYLYNGHAKTIRPDKRKLAVYLDNPNIGWKTFKRHMFGMRAHSDAKGIEMKRPNDSIYSFPCPNCMCRANRTEDSRTP